MKSTRNLAGGGQIYPSWRRPDFPARVRAHRHWSNVVFAFSAQPATAYAAAPAQTAYVQPATQTAYASTTARAPTYDAYQATQQYAYAARTQVSFILKYDDDPSI